MREKEFLPILEEKYGITELNPMQQKMLAEATKCEDTLLLSPTGSGKTIAFILPVLKMLKAPTGRVQCIVLAPSRELVIQIAGVFNTLATGYKVSVLYGGHKVEDEVNTLKVAPDVIVATPGRMLDHIGRRNVDVLPCRILVLDEFDKMLELGFEAEIKKICNRLKNVSKRILTSATRSDVLPEFLQLNNPLEISFQNENADLRARLSVKRVKAEGKDKLEDLLALINGIMAEEDDAKSIVFVNHRESAERVYEFLKKRGVDCVLYHGALDQRRRETAVVMFNNGSRPVLVATDLAARGLDIEGVKNVIHYHQALTPEAYTHRNGRTARVDREGSVYILTGPDEEIKPYGEVDEEVMPPKENLSPKKSGLDTIAIDSGKKEKISKGDIVGFLTKTCGLQGNEVGVINIFDHYSLVAVPKKAVKEILSMAKTSRLKGAKRRFSLVE